MSNKAITLETISVIKELVQEEIQKNTAALTPFEKAQLIDEIKQAVIADMGDNVAHYQNV